MVAISDSGSTPAASTKFYLWQNLPRRSSPERRLACRVEVDGRRRAIPKLSSLKLQASVRQACRVEDITKTDQPSLVAIQGAEAAAAQPIWARSGHPI